MYQRSVVRFCGFVLVAFLSLLAGCSKQVPSGELGSSVTCPATPNPKTYYVKQSVDGGSNSNAGTSLTSAWGTIQHAVNQACPGDTIRVQPGHLSGTTYAPYTENVFITTSGKPGFPISLIGEDWNKVKIAFTGANFNYIGKAAITLDNPNGEVTNWLIKGFRIDGCTSSATCTPYIYSGVYMENVRGIDVNQIWVNRSGGPGIMVYPRVNCYDTKTLCVTQNYEVKIYGNGIDYPNLGDVNGAYAQEALTLSLIDNFDVYDNIVMHGTKEGITVKDASRNGRIYRNTVSDFVKLSTLGAPTTSAGIYVGGQYGESFGIDIYNNKVYNNYGSGIVIATEHPSFIDGSAGNGKLIECLRSPDPINNPNLNCKLPTNTVLPIKKYLYNHDMRIYNNVVYNNARQGLPGYGIAIGSHARNIEVYHNTFNGNNRSLQVNNNYEGSYSQDITFRNNIFSNSQIVRGIIGNVGSNIKLENNLFTGSAVGDTYDVTANSINNVTPAGNSCYTQVKDRCPGQPTYNKVVSTATTLYAPTVDNPFALSASSPAINAGNSVIGLATFDVTKPTARARPTPATTNPDIGAYESPN